MGAGKDKLSKIPYTVLQFNEDGRVVNEVSHNLENIYLDPYRVEAIARTILPDKGGDTGCTLCGNRGFL